jgi:YggT family protein
VDVPIRRVMPTLGGLDFSPMVVLLALQFLRNLTAHRPLAG